MKWRELAEREDDSDPTTTFDDIREVNNMIDPYEPDMFSVNKSGVVAVQPPTTEHTDSFNELNTD